jgi:pimeloyl-ACP methyl ester carboxylesterase
MRTGTLHIEGGTLETAWWGPAPSEAPTLVLLHEGLGSVSLWRDIPSRLAAATNCGVFAYSRFGYGNSDTTPLPRPMTYLQDEARNILPQVLQAAGIEQAVLIGHSDGGSIAAVYAGSLHTRSVALTSWPKTLASSQRVSPPNTPASSQYVSPPNTPASGQYVSPLNTPVSIQHASWPGLARPPTTSSEPAPTQPILLGLITIAAHFIVEDLNIVSIREIKAEYETGKLRERLTRYHRDVDTAFRGWNDAWLDPRFQHFDITAYLPQIQVPILALQGADDPYGSDVQLRVMAENVQVPITTQLIPNAKHAPHLEATDATLAAITTFIAALPQGPRH